MMLQADMDRTQKKTDVLAHKNAHDGRKHARQ